MTFLPPQETNDAFEFASNLLNNNQDEGFFAPNVPQTSGIGTRQSFIPNNRIAISKRNLIYWLVPEGPIIQMYINPQNISYPYRKVIVPQRTIGGYTIQYWGPEITVLKIQGTTGTSGIEGINVLYDIYNNENLQFDPYALLLAAKKENESITAGLIDTETNEVLNDIFGQNQNLFQGNNSIPTLGSLACSVEMYYSGEVYRGYFTDFSVTESAQNIGLFDYDLTFNVTQKRGWRNNFMPWHRSATSGPSNSDPKLGIPHSYGSLSSESPVSPRQNASNSETLNDVINSLRNNF